MQILDCESRESALSSIADIYGVDPADVSGFLRGFDLESHLESVQYARSPETELTSQFGAAIGRQPSKIDRTCWFHLTRTSAHSDFSNGIQPLTNSLDVVWGAVLDVFRGSEHEGRLRGLQSAGVQDAQYQLKHADPFHAGPYAWLVREIAFFPSELGNHNYLWLPEIMEDICNGYQAKHGVSIADQLSRALVPKIVKFWTERQNDDESLKSALFYLYSAYVKSDKPCRIPDHGFDGENKGIQPDRILKVETVENW